MANSGFNQSQTGNASEVGAGVVKLATVTQIENKDADDGGIPLVITPDKLPAGGVFSAATQRVLDGSTTPQAVAFLTDGYLWATDPANSLNQFSGFITADLSAQPQAQFLGSGVSLNASFSATIPAGTNRVMVITINTYQAAAFTTGIDVDASAMTQIAQETTGGAYDVRQETYIIALGSGVGYSASVVTTGGIGPFDKWTYQVFEGIDQTTMYENYSTDKQNGLSTNRTFTITGLTNPSIVVLAVSVGGNAISGTTYTPGATIIDTTAISGNDVSIGYQVFNFAGQFTNQVTAGGAGTDSCVQSGFNLITDVTASAEIVVQYDGVLAGFTGLTAGLFYYIDAAGAITATPTNGNLPCGRAVSTTELLIKRGRQRAIGTILGSGPTRINLGFRPSVIRAYGGFNNTGATGLSSVNFGIWLAGTNVRAFLTGENALGAGTSATNGISATDNGAVVTVGSVDDTGFTFTHGDWRACWEAEE